ncbi:hypothetical protein HHI36_019995, partial [Cryptolaemus montrouzieri]
VFLWHQIYSVPIVFDIFYLKLTVTLCYVSIKYFYFFLAFIIRRKNAGVFMCECGRSYKYIRNLRQHQRFDCGKAPRFACPLCPRKCRTRFTLKMHIEKHNKLNL